MIRRLRIRLVAVSMLSLFIVLTVIMGTMAVVSWQNLTDNADFTLSILEDNGGVFPKSEDFILEGRVPGKPDKIRQFSPELPYETRYFTVQLNEEGVILSTNTGRIAAIDSETAMEFARTIWEKQSTRGFLGDYRYLVHANDQGYQIIFLDCGRNLDSYRNFMLTGIGVCFGGMLAVLFLLILLSGRIIKPVAESYDRQKQFVTDANHELKTPLTLIRANVDILESETGPNEWLSDIRDETALMSQLVGHLVTLARMDEEKSHLEMQPFDLAEAVFDTASMFTTPAENAGKELTVQAPSTLIYSGNEAAIRQLLSILLDNAVKYCDPGGSIRVELVSGKHPILTVDNTCTTVDSLPLSKLFDRFYRADPARTYGSGFGIGLSIAKGIVEKHHGEISALKENSQTIRFRIKL